MKLVRISKQPGPIFIDMMLVNETGDSIPLPDEYIDSKGERVTLYPQSALSFSWDEESGKWMVYR